ncbi:hypothetical protein L1987_48657 [Smallanthus sonchifolius]|uniref:Uncharacterized protein n=1 Tax=Smallanthus sonchifolius TaxID=185202 RepID=A0ACB9FRX9_9ASTR|nr:hypothetical protein L1987_48657 [Smallanthus sonchifolius]
MFLTDMDLLFVKRHNVCAFLNAADPKSAGFKPVLNFLDNSNLSVAISHDLPVFETTIRQFWDTTTTVIDNVEHIRAIVHNQKVLLSEATIREVLHFNDNPEAPVEFPSSYVKECFRRLGHPDEFKSGQIIKNSLPSQRRYIVHIFIHCLSIRKGGFDSANSIVASVVLGLIKGRDYNFSGLVFGKLKENMTGGVKEKFLVYPSYMKSSRKRTNRVIADIPLFGHILGEVEEEVPDMDPQLQVESSLSEEEEEEIEQDQGVNEEEQEVEAKIPHDQEVEQPILEAHFLDLELANIEEQVQLPPMIVENVEAESSGTLDEGIYVPEHLTPIHSPIHVSTTPQPTPQPTPPISPAHETSPTVPRLKSLSLEVKKLQNEVTKKDGVIESLKTDMSECKDEKLISQQQQDLKFVIDLVNQLKDSLVKSSDQETASTAPGETTFAGGPSSPTFVTNPESTMTIFTGPATKSKEVMEVKIEDTQCDLTSASERRAARERGKGKESNVEVVILDEEEIGSDHELNELLNQIDNYGINDNYPEIMTTRDQSEERTRYFIDQADEIQALPDDDKEESNVQVDLVKPVILDEKTTTHTEPTPTECTPTEPIQAPKPNPEYPYLTGLEFSSLPRYDMRALAKLPLQNPGKSMGLITLSSYCNNKPSMTSETVKSIILPRSVPVQLQNFKKWFYNSTIGSAVIECEGMDDIQIFEPMELLKFQPEDLEVLLNNLIKIFHEDDEPDAKAYQRVVTINAKSRFQKSSQEPTA